MRAECMMREGGEKALVGLWCALFAVVCGVSSRRRGGVCSRDFVNGCNILH